MSVSLGRRRLPDREARLRRGALALDLDLLEDAVGGSSIAVDENNQMIFTGNSGLSPATLNKYFIGNDSLQLVQSIQAGGNGVVTLLIVVLLVVLILKLMDKEITIK